MLLELAIVVGSVESELINMVDIVYGSVVACKEQKGNEPQTKIAPNLRLFGGPQHVYNGGRTDDVKYLGRTVFETSFQHSS